MGESSSYVIMGWHTCLVCKGSSDFHCYCCKRASCSRHIGLIDFVHHKGNYGFCNNCLKLALLVEEDRNVDSDGESVDLRDRETYEGLFREYYEIVKEKEGFDKNILLAGKRSEEEDEQPESTAPQCQFAALIPENIKLVYLKKSLLLEMIEQPESIETKIIGSFVRVKLDPRDNGKRNSHQLVQITGIKHGSNDNYNSESSIQVSNMAGDVCLTMLSDGEITKEECDELQKKMKAGLLKKLTIAELEQKAKILHEDITKHWIARELELLKNRMNHANEKGWRHQYYQLEQKRELLLQPSYLSFKLENIPRVIPEEVELESLDRNDMTQMQNIPGLIPNKIELPPLAVDEHLSSDNVDFSDGEPQTKRLQKKRCTQQKPKKRRRVHSTKKEFVGWGSKPLIEFLHFIGQDTREKLSLYDVASIVTKYVKEHSLIHPVKERSILCDVQLEAIFGEEVVDIHRIVILLKSHLFSCFA